MTGLVNVAGSEDGVLTSTGVELTPPPQPTAGVSGDMLTSIAPQRMRAPDCTSVGPQQPVDVEALSERLQLLDDDAAQGSNASCRAVAAVGGRPRAGGAGHD